MPVPKGFTLDKPVKVPKGFTLDEPRSQSAKGSPFAATPDNKEGTYQMQSPDGNPISVPYSKVMQAAKSGYLISPEDRLRYGKDKLWSLRGFRNYLTNPEMAIGENIVGRPLFNPDKELPETYEEVSPASPWYDPNFRKVERGAIDLIPTAGAIAGGIGAGALGLATTGPGAAAWEVAGNTAGGAAGEALRQELTELLFPFDTRMTPKEKAKDIALQGGIMGGLSILGEGASIPLNAATKYLGETALASSKAGVRLLPSEASGVAPTWMENYLKGSILSRSIMDKFRTLQNKETTTAVNKLIDSISSFKGTPEELGILVQKGLDDSAAATRAEQNILYDALDNLTEDVVTPAKPKYSIVLKKNGKPLLDSSGKPVMKKTMIPEVTRVMPSMVSLKDFARENLEKINKPPYFLPPDALEKARGAFNTILDNPDHVSFKRMRDMRSVLLSQVRDLDQTMGGSKLGLAKKFESLTDQSIEDAAKKSGIPGLYKRWREANAVTAEGHRLFEQKLVEKVTDTNDPEFIASLLGGNRIGIQQTRDLFKALPEKLHNPVRRGLLEDAVSKATEPRNGAFDEGKFATYIEKIGDERGKIIFGENWKNVKQIADIMGKINGPVGLERGGGAVLQNIGIMKRLGSIALGGGPELIALATGAGTGHLLESAQAVATEAATARAVALAMTHPAKAAKMLNFLRNAVKYSPQLGYTAYYEGEDLSRRHDKRSSSPTDEINNETKNSIDTVKNKAKSLMHSSNSQPPYTHRYDESTGRIVPAQ